MITKNKLFICMSISYFMGTGIGYITKTDVISPLSTKIIGILFGLGFATYMIAPLLDIKE
jgi:hypothetical protein